VSPFSPIIEGAASAHGGKRQPGLPTSKVVPSNMTRRFLIESFAGWLPQVTGGQSPSRAPNRIFQRDLPDLVLKGWSATAVEVNYGPGEGSAAHRHPGITIAYVLEGEIASKVGDEPERTYRKGEMFLEMPGQLHAVSRNASTSQPAKLLAVLLAERGKELTTPVR
jgi:quercetin dioxygenase-like cupin family protein